MNFRKESHTGFISFSVQDLLSSAREKIEPVRKGGLGFIIELVGSHPLRHLGQTIDSTYGDHNSALKELDEKSPFVTSSTADLIPWVANRLTPKNPSGQS